MRAREESFSIRNLNSAEPIFSNFEIHSASGMTYQAEIRDLIDRQFSCTCTDFRINGLGTCKHVEALLLHLARRERAAFATARRVPSHRIDVVSELASERLRVERNWDALPPSLRDCFDSDGLSLSSIPP